MEARAAAQRERRAVRKQPRPDTEVVRDRARTQESSLLSNPPPLPKDTMFKEQPSSQENKEFPCMYV